MAEGILMKKCFINLILARETFARQSSRALNFFDSLSPKGDLASLVLTLLHAWTLEAAEVDYPDCKSE